MIGDVLRGLVLLACVAVSGPVAAQGVARSLDPEPITVTPATLFVFADRARDAGDFATAERAYRALSSNTDIEVRSEARFRLAMMLADRQQRWRDAAVELRKILDEKPAAARIRLELARMDALLGRLGAAERELRAAQAAGLPGDVEQIVRFYARALSARKPFGGSFEAAIAPDSNINRATRSDTLGTIIGDFVLDPGAKARSGVGLALRGQSYVRGQLGGGPPLLLRLSGSADLYRDKTYDDVTIGAQLGPELVLGRDRLSVSVGPAWRWYGMIPYSFVAAANATFQHPTGKRSQLRVESAVVRTDNRRNDLQDSWAVTLSTGIDRQLSARAGVGLLVYGVRDAARDPGYSTSSGGLNAYVFREFGKTSAVLSLGYSHLESDARLFLYPNRRRDDRYFAALAGTFRAFRLGSFAPLARIRWEANRSTVELYDYRRVAAEFGVVSAF